jgi:hypothetical protein
VSRRLGFAWLGVVLLWAFGASALESDGFTLETGSPDALCPELEATREIVARRLGSLVVEGRKGWLARYTIGHAPAGSPRDFVRLELFNPEGAVELRRDLPIEGDSCRTMAEVIALVLDRHFRGLVAGDESAQASPERPRLQGSAAASRAPRAPPEPVRAPQVAMIGKGPRLSAEYATHLAEPYLGLRVRAGFGRTLEAGLGLRWGMTSLEEKDPRGARIEAHKLTSRVSLAWKLALPPGLLHLGPAVSLAFEQATTRGLQNQTDRTRAVWMVGAEAGYAVAIGRGLFIEGSTSLDFLVPGTAGQFLVDNREVLAPRALTLGWAVGFGYVWDD